MHSLYHQACDTMVEAHVNHFERDGVLPIAFCLFHIVNMIDSSFMLMTGAMPIWNQEWQDRVQMSVNDHGKHRTVDDTPYGGGPGMVMKPEPWGAALDEVLASGPGGVRPVVVVPTPSGTPFTQRTADCTSSRQAGQRCLGASR